MIDPRTATMSREALSQAVELAFPVLVQHLQSRFRDPQLAEEVSHDCLCEAFEQWRADPAYFARHDLAAWGRRRAGWRAIDRLRQRTRFAPLPDENLAADERSRVKGVPMFDPAESQRLDDRARTWEAIQQLDELDRRVLIGHYYDGRSDQELGTELFGESGTVTARGLRVWRLRQRAQERLREQLVSGGFDSDDYTGQAV